MLFHVASLDINFGRHQTLATDGTLIMLEDITGLIDLRLGYVDTGSRRATGLCSRRGGVALGTRGLEGRGAIGILDRCGGATQLWNF